MNVTEIAKKLLSFPSITPNDAGCQKFITDFLTPLGFKCETLQFEDVTNLYARIGTVSPLFLFAGHTDVVPTGPLSAWTSPPFEPTIRDGMLYARGACDMKGAIAAMLSATQSYLENNKQFAGSIGFLITSDEEGPSIHGTKRVMEALNARNEKIDFCIVGEPSSKALIGDQIRIGRRGSLQGTLTVIGKQGHVAFPELADNAIHSMGKALAALCDAVWDEGNHDFPKTTFQVSNITGGTGALNVIPGECRAEFNFRFGTASTVESLQTRVKDILDAVIKHYDITWKVSAEPFLTHNGKLRKIVSESIYDMLGYRTNASTGGGTSDARFIAKTNAEVIELGLINETAHKIDECISVNDLEVLAKVYQDILQRVF